MVQYGYPWSIMVKNIEYEEFADFMPDLINFGQIYQIWPCLVSWDKFGQMWLKMAFYGPIYTTEFIHDQL